MEQRMSSSNSTLQAKPGVAFLHALNAAAASLQRSARSEAEVFRAVREQIVGLGLRGGTPRAPDGCRVGAGIYDAGVAGET